MSSRTSSPLLTRRCWLLAAACTAALAGCAPLAPMPASDVDPLPSWHAGPAKQRIIDFVRAVCTAGSRDYVAPVERIAVFAHDGTLWTEYPVDAQMRFVSDRIRALAAQRPQWREQEPFRSVLAGDLPRALAGGEAARRELTLAAQSGMSLDAFDALVRRWIGQAKDERFGRPYETLSYQPMHEVLWYLRSNAFRIYLVTSGGQEFVRAFAERVYGIPPERVIGSRQELELQVRGRSAELRLQPRLAFLNDDAHKPVAIETAVGRRPVAAFGSADHDLAMLQYTTSGPGQRLGMLVHHDDPRREYAYDRDAAVGRLSRGLDLYKSWGWTLISMRDDWKTVFDPLP